MFTIVRKLFQQHPLVTVLLIGAIPRLIAVVFSKGFIHLDDYYDTVMVAYQWCNDGMWGADGLLTWKGNDAGTIYRFPLYNLILCGIFRTHQILGVESLNTMMYTVRAIHGAVSLVPIWAAYHICRISTGRTSWAIAGGLVIALHGAMPFLGVRNLIEMVGGTLWLLAVVYLYRYKEKPAIKWLYVAGIVTGLAWMIRFQIAFAAVPIPFILWWLHKSLRPAIHYSLALGTILLMSGFVDWYFLGEFARSTVFLLREGAHSGPLYDTVPFLFLVLLLVLLIPPLSGLLFYTIGRPSFWQTHILLFASTVSFIVVHSLLANQQERFVLPIVPAAMVLAVLSLHHWSKGDFSRLWQRPLVRRLAIPSVILNLVLLLVLTPAYGRRGLIEPLLEIRKLNPDATMLVIQPGQRYYMPISYFGPRAKRQYVKEWKDMDALRKNYGEGMRFDYIIVYPGDAAQLSQYCDSASAVIGPMVSAFEVKPSLYDWLTHALNPRHNHSFEAWVYRPAVK